jgi:hypothetical protein
MSDTRLRTPHPAARSHRSHVWEITYRKLFGLWRIARPLHPKVFATLNDRFMSDARKGI